MRNARKDFLKANDKKTCVLLEIFADEAHKRLHVVHQILQHAQFIVSSVLHKYAQNQVTLLVHIYPTMFVPNFVHSCNT